MKKLYIVFLVFFLTLVTGSQLLIAQCMTYPVPFEHRIGKANYIVMGKVVQQEAYIDAPTGNIYTLNRFKISAWLKNYLSTDEVYVITIGGVVGNKAMITHPALELDTDHEYILMLEADNRQIDNKLLRAQNPQALQMLPYAEAQGSLTNERHFYHDLHYRKPKPEKDIFAEISMLTLQQAKKPSGELFVPRNTIDETSNGTAAITGFTPAVTHSGTIVPADYITISGSGFGAAAGTIFYTNADDGGATFTSSGVATDNVSWSATSIVNKPARRAGTGPINVNGAFTSATNLTVPYSHIEINSNFSGFGSTTRQRYYLVNKNSTGGYTLTFNTAFAANAPAANAFARALLLWRCNTYVNIKYSGSTSAISTAVLDGINIVTFDASLPVGVLGRATSRFNGNAIGGCNLTNTVWWADELDMQFAPDPPTAGFPWQYGPAAPAFTEYDFESVALHEIGHFHGLGHIINPLAVMHFALANGSTSRILSTDDIAGGVAKMSYSTIPLCFNPATVVSEMVSLTAADCVLPVNIIDFFGKRQNNSANKLNWVTATENNNAGFFLQRSEDVTGFKNLEFIKGAGTSSQNTFYEYLDNTAGPWPWFYRLKQIDLNGAEKFSKTIYVPGTEAGDWKIWASGEGKKVFIYHNQPPVVITTINISNSIGQTVITKQINNGREEINTAYLPRGIYNYHLQTGDRKVTGRLVLGGN